SFCYHFTAIFDFVPQGKRIIAIRYLFALVRSIPYAGRRFAIFQLIICTMEDDFTPSIVNDNFQISNQIIRVRYKTFIYSTKPNGIGITDGWETLLFYFEVNKKIAAILIRCDKAVSTRLAGRKMYGIAYFQAIQHPFC